MASGTDERSASESCAVGTAGGSTTGQRINVAEARAALVQLRACMGGDGDLLQACREVDTLLAKRLETDPTAAGGAHGEVVTNLRHIWRTKFLFANILDRANCSCLFTSTSISPQVSPKTLKHSAKLSELFSGRSFFPTIFVLRKI